LISVEFKMRTSLIKRGVFVVAALLPLAGCSAAPSTNILGSYFPSWMICVLIGMGLAFVIRWILVKLGVEKELPAPIVVYLLATIAFSFAAWLLWLA
jgi:hypothetical protein